MAKSDKATVVKRTNEVLKLLLAGAEFEDIRQYASDKGWQLSDRQIRRYQEWAYTRLAEATKQDEQQLLGRHLMQRRALYARSLKANDIRTALSVLKDEAALEGLYPPTKVAPTTPDGKHPYLGASGPPLSKKERLRRLLAADAREDQEEIRLIDHATPQVFYSAPDTFIPLQMLGLISFMYVAEQLDRAGMFMMALWRLSVGDGNLDTWNEIGICHGYRFKVETEGWELFTKSLNVPPDWLITVNHQGSMLELFSEQICNLAPTREEFLESAARQGLTPEKIPTAKAVSRKWIDLMDQALRP